MRKLAFSCRSATSSGRLTSCSTRSGSAVCDRALPARALPPLLPPPPPPPPPLAAFPPPSPLPSAEPPPFAAAGGGASGFAASCWCSDAFSSWSRQAKQVGLSKQVLYSVRAVYCSSWYRVYTLACSRRSCCAKDACSCCDTCCDTCASSCTTGRFWMFLAREAYCSVLSVSSRWCLQ